MSNVKSNIPDYTIPFIDGTGRISEVWWRFLVTMFNRTGGTTGSDIGDLIITVNAQGIRVEFLEAEQSNFPLPVDFSRPIDELCNEIAGLRGALNDLPGRISDLETQVGSNTLFAAAPIAGASFTGPVNFNNGTSTPLAFSQFFFTNQYGVGTPDSNGLQVFAADVGGGVRIGTRTSLLVFTQQALVNTSGLQVTAGFGCNTKTAQTAFASGGAAPVGGTGTAAGGWDTAAHRDSAITLLNNIRTALVNNGIMT